MSVHRRLPGGDERGIGRIVHVAESWRDTPARRSWDSATTPPPSEQAGSYSGLPWPHCTVTMVAKKVPRTSDAYRFFFSAFSLHGGRGLGIIGGMKCLSIIEFATPIPYSRQVGLFNVDEKSLPLTPADRKKLRQFVKQHG